MILSIPGIKQKARANAGYTPVASKYKGFLHINLFLEPKEHSTWKPRLDLSFKNAKIQAGIIF
jgi:hypothetical protein